MLIPPWNSIVLIPPRVCDIFLWTFLLRQGSSLNAQTYPFWISRKENDEPRRLSKEIKKYLKLKLTWIKARTDLRNSWEDLWRLFEGVMNDLVFGEFECLNTLNTLNCDEEKRKYSYKSLYKGLKTRGILSRPNLEGKHGPLDQNPSVGCQKHNAAQNT